MSTVSPRTDLGPRRRTVPGAPPAPSVLGVRRRDGAGVARRRPDLEAVAAFVLPLSVYLAVGIRLALDLRGLPGDALSRTAAASAVLHGRDPHLESIGFVWGPFPTLWQVPVIWLADAWRPIVADGFAAVVVSATTMAAMVAVVRRWLADCGVAAPTRLLLVAALAFNPWIVLYGANGMSEAGLLLFGAIAARRLARWWESARGGDLVACGVALAFAYLTRYEALASIAVVVLVVGARAWSRSTWRSALVPATVVDRKSVV